MINTRSLDALLPAVRERAQQFLGQARGLGLDVLVTSTYRDFAAQAALYAQGRTRPGRIVTYARPGYSWHNWGRAFDVVPLRHGKPVWGTTGSDGQLWLRLGELGEAVGLEWAGRWSRRRREYPHFQLTEGHTLAQLLAAYPQGLPHAALADR